MSDTRKTKQEPIEEPRQLRRKLTECGQSQISSDALNELYRRAVDIAPVSVWACDRDWQIVYWNSGAERLYESSRENVIGKSFLELFITDDERVRALLAIERVFKGETIADVMAEDKTSSGKRKTVLVTSYPIYGENGEVSLYGEVALDISDVAPTDVYRVAVEAPAVSIWACDENWQIKFWNAGAERIYNARREEVVGKSFFDLFVSENDKAKAIQDIQAAFAGREIENYVAEDILPDGTTRFILTNTYPVYNDSGNVVLLAEIGQDITREEVSRRTLHDISKRLTSANKLTEQQILELVYEQASRLMDTGNMYIALYDGEKDEVSFGLAMENGRRVDIHTEPGWQPRMAGEGLTEWVINTRQAQRPANLEEVYATVAKDYIQSIPNSWMGIPLMFEGQVIGVIVLRNYESFEAYDRYHQNTLQVIVDYAAIAIQNARLYQELAQKNDELQMLYELGTGLNASLPV